MKRQVDQKTDKPGYLCIRLSNAHDHIHFLYQRFMLYAIEATDIQISKKFLFHFIGPLLTLAKYFKKLYLLNLSLKAHGSINYFDQGLNLFTIGAMGSQIPENLFFVY